MKNNFTIFYSWQSDLNSKENRNLINTCIEKAISAIKKHGEIKLEINIDRDTKNRAGSVPISDTIFDKIKQSDIFICDVSLINNTLARKIDGSRLTPNPNVLIELGFAVNMLGWDRIICISNLKYGEIELLPFDIRGHKIISYNSKDISKAKSDLTSILKSAISKTINDYEEILQRFSETNFISHDIAIYNKINAICNEETLLDSISMAINSLATNDYYYKKWDSLDDFFKTSKNHFINEDLNQAFRNFLSALRNFEMLCVQKFFSLRDGSKIVQEEDEDEEFKGQNYLYGPHKHPLPGENWGDADERIHTLQNRLLELGKATKEAYTAYIYLAKRRLLIS